MLLHFPLVLPAAASASVTRSVQLKLFKKALRPHNDSLESDLDDVAIVVHQIPLLVQPESTAASRGSKIFMAQQKVPAQLESWISLDVTSFYASHAPSTAATASHFLTEVKVLDSGDRALPVLHFLEGEQCALPTDGTARTHDSLEPRLEVQITDISATSTAAATTATTAGDAAIAAAA